MSELYYLPLLGIVYVHGIRSYDVGIIHFVGMSTEHNYTRGSEQYAWIENDLKSVNRSLTPWIIFGGHRYENMRYVVLKLNVDAVERCT